MSTSWCCMLILFTWWVSVHLLLKSLLRVHGVELVLEKTNVWYAPDMVAYQGWARGSASKSVNLGPVSCWTSLVWALTSTDTFIISTVFTMKYMSLLLLSGPLHWLSTLGDSQNKILKKVLKWWYYNEVFYGIINA